MVIDVPTENKLVARLYPLLDLLMKVRIECDARASVIILKLKMRLVLGPHRSRADAVFARSIEADAPKVCAILAQESRPSPPTKAGFVTSGASSKVRDQSMSQHSGTSPLPGFGDSSFRVVAASGLGLGGI